MSEQDLAALKTKINVLLGVYLVLFGASIVMIILKTDTLMWGVTLGSAVLCRVYRTSVVNRYNELGAAEKKPPLVS